MLIFKTANINTASYWWLKMYSDCSVCRLRYDLNNIYLVFTAAPGSTASNEIAAVLTFSIGAYKFDKSNFQTSIFQNYHAWYVRMKEKNPQKKIQE